MKPCPYCGTPLPNPRRVQCGAPECFRAWRNQRQREYFAKRLAEDGVRYEDRYKVERTCDCGATFQSRHLAERCPPCARREQRRVAAVASASANRARAAERAALRKQLSLAGPLRRAETLRYREAARRAHIAATGSRSKRAVYVGGVCRRCEALFVCLWTNDLPQWCSTACSRADQKRVRRGRERGGKVVRYSRRAIFERDRWTCRLCGKRVKRTARVPHPKAAVIDHIVPLAAGPEAGGVDAPWNVQCAHFLCNSIKRDLLSAPALF